MTVEEQSFVVIDTVFRNYSQMRFGWRRPLGRGFPNRIFEFSSFRDRN